MPGAIAHRVRRQDRGAAIAVLVVGSSLVVAIASAGALGSLRVNLTPSEPLGLWRIVPLNRPAIVGDLVFVCLPPDVAAPGFARGYLRSGLCSGGTAPLIKTVVAISGADVAIRADVTIDGRPLPHSHLATTDGAGRSLIPWRGGVVPADALYLHSDFMGSYDSRYFGPVPAAGVIGLAQPLLTIDP